MPEKLVIDCSVAAKWVLPEPDRLPALALFDQYAQGEIDLIAPDILLAEFASLLAKRSRRKQLSALQAEAAFVLMTKCAPKLFEAPPRLSHALAISLREQVSLWDALYLSLSVEYACPVITADARLFKSTRHRGQMVRMLA